MRHQYLFPYTDLIGCCAVWLCVLGALPSKSMPESLGFIDVFIFLQCQFLLCSTFYGDECLCVYLQMIMCQSVLPVTCLKLLHGRQETSVFISFVIHENLL